MKENEFSKITELLPAGREEAAKETDAFTQIRKIKKPEKLLRLNLL